MNRRLRREAARASGPLSIHLLGGPMAGWLVKPQAPVLLPDWWESWPESIAERWWPGFYELLEEQHQARWVEYQREAPSSGHGAVPQLPEAGGEEGQV